MYAQANAEESPKRQVRAVLKAVRKAVSRCKNAIAPMVLTRLHQSRKTLNNFIMSVSLRYFVIIALSVGFFMVPHFGFAHELGTQTIHMSDIGYEPQNVTISVGESVVFENVGSKSMWPASNIHPTHRAYPGSDIELCDQPKQRKELFDACRGIIPGETYEFVFDQPGRWRYHDHLNPEFTGVIVVEGEAVFPQEPKLTLGERIKKWVDTIALRLVRWYYRMYPEELDSKLARVNMMQVTQDTKQLYYWLNLIGGDAVMEKLLKDADGGYSIDCHTHAHQIGRAAYDLFGAEVFSQGDASCHSGFYHGAMESFLSQEGTADLAEHIDDLCNSFDTYFGRFECLHGVGHGVMAYEDYDLPLALETCKQLDGDFAQSSCYGGVFMENVVAGQGNGALPGHTTDWVNFEDYHFPCNAISQENIIQQECYKMQTSWMLTLSGVDFDTVARACEQADSKWIRTCYISYGRDAAGYSLRKPEGIIELCKLIPNQNEYYNDCIYGGLNVIIDFWGEKLSRQASELCSALSSETSKAYCYQITARRIPQLHNDPKKLANICQTFEEKYQYLCQ